MEKNNDDNKKNNNDINDDILQRCKITELRDIVKESPDNLDISSLNPDIKEKDVKIIQDINLPIPAPVYQSDENYALSNKEYNKEMHNKLIKEEMDFPFPVSEDENSDTSIDIDDIDIEFDIEVDIETIQYLEFDDEYKNMIYQYMTYVFYFRCLHKSNKDFEDFDFETEPFNFESVEAFEQSLFEQLRKIEELYDMENQEYMEALEAKLVEEKEENEKDLDIDSLLNYERKRFKSIHEDFNFNSTEKKEEKYQDDFNDDFNSIEDAHQDSECSNYGDEEECSEDSVNDD